MDYTTLIREAMEVRKLAWAPYSQFAVGAALLCNTGKIYRGCNIENAAYGSTLCAERVALSKAISEGDREFIAIAIVGGQQSREGLYNHVFPCGACRQFMQEFCTPSFEIIVAASEADYLRYTLSELLPGRFCARDYANNDPTRGIVKADFGKPFN